MKRLLLTLAILLLVSSFAFAGFERSLHYLVDVNSPAAMNLEGGLVFDYISVHGDQIDKTWVLDAYAKYGIIDNWEIGFDVPFVDWSSYSPIAIDGHITDGERGIGDINVWTKYRFFNEDQNCFGLAAGLNAKLATGEQRDGLGTGHVNWMPFIMGTIRPAEPLVLGAKVGYNYISNDDWRNIDHQWFGTVWGGYMATPKLGIVTELNGNTQPGKDPISIDAGITYAATDNIGLIAGGGKGLNGAAADWHAFAGVKAFIALKQ